MQIGIANNVNFGITQKAPAPLFSPKVMRRLEEDRIRLKKSLGLPENPTYEQCLQALDRLFAEK